MEIFEINGNTLSLALFTDVTNSKELLESMQDGKQDPEVAFLNASLHYKTSGPEVGVSTLADAITCRIAAWDAL